MNDTINRIRGAMPLNCTIDHHINTCGQGLLVKGKICDKDVVFKFFRKDHNYERVVREVQFLKSIKKDNIVQLIDNFEILLNGSRIVVIAYEFLDGLDLRSIVGTNVDESNLLEIGLNISDAIEFLWRNPTSRIVHRDIKPENIMRTSTKRIVLIDFGLARFIDLNDLTSDGRSPGTEGYKSPEQSLAVKNLTFKSDVYSLGITLFEIASGKHPFERDQMKMLLGSNPLALSDFRPDLSSEFEELILKMLQRDAYLRPKNLFEQFKMLT